MDPLNRVRLNSQIYEEASSWFVECRAGDLDEAARREFDRWLRKSPEHVSAYLEVAAIWNEGPALDPTRQWDLDTLIAQAAAEPDNVVPLSVTSAVPELETSLPRPQALAAPSSLSRGEAPAEGSLLLGKENNSHPSPLGRGRGWGTHPRKLLAFAASVALLTVLGSFWIWLSLFSGIYSTAIGEQRSIELADGSTVEMNSKSRIRVRYTKNERDVDLLEGQALFHVAKDRARPFIVRADGTRVRAVGTQFDVYEKHSGTVVTVVEGEVAVLAPVNVEAPVAAPEHASATRIDIPITTIPVAAGEQLTVTPKLAHKSEHPNVAAATAWTERRIVFESATLSEVAEEFNRYNERQLVIEDPGLYDFHISGVFSSTDPDSLIRFLRERPGVKVTETDSQVRVARSS
jgi:transmembrane sensor